MGELKITSDILRFSKILNLLSPKPQVAKSGILLMDRDKVQYLTYLGIKKQ